MPLARKLIGLIVVLVASSVLIPTIYFRSSELGYIHHRITRKATVYGDLMTKELQSAVAFNDQQTAREELAALASDGDFAAAAVVGDDGRVLAQIGTLPPGSLVEVAAPVLLQDDDDAVIAAAPIVTDEGPRGTIVLELSTASASADRARVTVAAALVGALVLFAGVVGGLLVTRSLTRRVRRLVDASTTIANGDLDRDPIADSNHDEIAVLARAFDGMVVKLRATLAGMKEINDGLEARIDERTIQLVDVNESLTAEMGRRARAEVELRSAQKLEAVGRLAAGVAHELNTPIQFVSDSCAFLREASVDLIGLATRARELFAAGESGAEAFAEAADAASLDYLVEQVPAALQRSLDGLSRMATIVRSMKEFSHPGHTRAQADLNRGIQSTIDIARNEYKYVADVVTELGDLPAVPCYLGELNQVFLNIIVNAAHAIKDVVKDSGERGTIRIKSWVDGAWVKISIADTGGGIPAEIREKIFEPFFTTKEVGRGTGQGLAIARAVVVDKHAGQIDVASELGVGTTFTLTIPIDAAGVDVQEAA